MLNRLPTPTQLPPLEIMLDDIGSPTAAELGRALGVTPRAVERWRDAGTAPRPVLLAIFWLTRWGMNAVRPLIPAPCAPIAEPVARQSRSRTAQSGGSAC